MPERKCAFTYEVFPKWIDGTTDMIPLARALHIYHPFQKYKSKTSWEASLSHMCCCCNDARCSGRDKSPFHSMPIVPQQQRDDDTICSAEQMLSSSDMRYYLPKSVCQWQCHWELLNRVSIWPSSKLSTITSEWNHWWCQYLDAVKIRHWSQHVCANTLLHLQHGSNWWLPSVWLCSVHWSPDLGLCALTDYWFNPGNASFFGTNFYPGCHQLFYSFVTLWHIIATSILIINEQVASFYQKTFLWSRLFSHIVFGNLATKMGD